MMLMNKKAIQKEENNMLINEGTWIHVRICGYNI
jgi:hypothetical protein